MRSLVRGWLLAATLVAAVAGIVWLPSVVDFALAATAAVVWCRMLDDATVRRSAGPSPPRETPYR